MPGRWSKLTWPLSEFISRNDFKKGGVENAAKDIIPKALNNPEINMASLSAGMVAAISFINGFAHHIFLESMPLFDFLANTEIKENVAWTESIMEKWGGNDAYEGLPSWMKTPVTKSELFGEKQAVIVVHIPDNRCHSCWAIAFKGLHGSMAVYSPYFGTMFEKQDVVMRLFTNVIHYMDAFPESISDSPPDDHLDGWRPIHRVHMHVNESILERGTITPHFRRGHFRHLVSEHWTKKRGKTVFVRSTFVKGKAITVEDVGDEKRELAQ